MLRRVPFVVEMGVLADGSAKEDPGVALMTQRVGISEQAQSVWLWPCRVTEVVIMRENLRILIAESGSMISCQRRTMMRGRHFCGKHQVAKSIVRQMKGMSELEKNANTQRPGRGGQGRRLRRRMTRHILAWKA